jgi:glyoxylase-like metal-dependent hydrolase (beta-lactamase superfamily II)
MTKIQHINCGFLHVPPYPKIVCHCLLLVDRSGLALVDTGIGLEDVRRPLERIGQPIIDMAGFQFHEADTAIRKLERLGWRPADVSDVIITHCDPDHVGGLADFPEARVHVSDEERASLAAGRFRYREAQFMHGPRWMTHGTSAERWFGLEARRVALGFASEVLLIPLFGHTLGHCGVAVQQRDRWVLHAGDAYYLRVEMETDDHPVSLIAAQRADDDAQRRQSLAELRRLAGDHGGEITIFGYHDPGEFPDAATE